MLFDMGIGELLIIGVVGLIIFGPDRLPRVAAQAAQFLRQLKTQADQAKASIIEAADIDESTLRDLRDLDPRRALRDVASPLGDVRNAANEALRVEPARITLPKATPGAPTVPTESAPSGQPAAETTTPEAPNASGVDHRDIV